MDTQLVASNPVYQEMYDWVKDLFLFCRSITGEKVHQTLRYIQQLLQGFMIREIPSGSQSLNWTVPDEWNIFNAYVKKIGITL